MSKNDSKIDYSVLEGLCSIQCTMEEVAAVMKLSMTQVKKLAANDPEFKRIWEQGQAFGRASLRRLQWRHARGFGPAAVAMAVHLGKHWLGQTDRSTLEIDHTVRVQTEGGTAADLLLRGVNVDLLAKHEAVELAKLCDQVDEQGIERLSVHKRMRFFSLIEKGIPTERASEPDGDITAPLMLPPPSENK